MGGNVHIYEGLLHKYTQVQLGKKGKISRFFSIFSRDKSQSMSTYFQK